MSSMVSGKGVGKLYVIPKSIHETQLSVKARQNKIEHDRTRQNMADTIRVTKFQWEFQWERKRNVSSNRISLERP